jgi:hypothetical protein
MTRAAEQAAYFLFFERPPAGERMGLGYFPVESSRLFGASSLAFLLVFEMRK